MTTTRRMPVVASYCPSYMPEWGLSPTREVIFDFALPLRRAGTCHQCGEQIVAERCARSRAEIVDEFRTIRLLWCEGCAKVHDDHTGEWKTNREVNDSTARLKRVLETANSAFEARKNIDALIAAGIAIKAVMDAEVVALAADWTLKYEAEVISENIRDLILELTPDELQRADEKRAVESEDAMDAFLQQRGIVTPTADGCDINITTLADLLGIEDETALALAKQPGAIGDVVTAFLKLKRED